MTMAGQVNPAFLVYQFLWKALDWIFPPSCGGCGRPGVRWCPECQEKITRIEQPICQRCGQPENRELLCQTCQSHPPYYKKLRSFAKFDSPLREALHRLKYQNDVGLGEPLSKHLVELYNQDRWDVDLVVSVPLSSKRLKERGYNQASVLARPFADAIQVRFQTNILLKKRETRTQVGLSAVERHQNLNDAFYAHPSRVKGKSILVIDDVATTGSTINACAQALCDAGASAVYGLTLTRAVLQADADDQPKPISL